MTEHIPDCGEAKRQAIRQSKLEALQRGIDAYEAEHPYRGPDGTSRRSEPHDPPKRLTEAIAQLDDRRWAQAEAVEDTWEAWGVLGLVVASVLLLGLVFAMLAHP